MNEKKKPRVILADDESHIREYLKAILVSMKCEVVGEAENGQEAVELYKSNKPDLIFLDVNMPLKTGDEALQEIMQEDSNAFVIMLTSVADMETVKDCIGKGAANYILKDTPRKEMMEMIKETWSNRLKSRNK
jgi:two-component system, chemotaxis family, chemotaxis protein CheY